jgi:recombination protein RecT
MSDQSAAEAARKAVQTQFMPETFADQSTSGIIQTLSRYEQRIAHAIPKSAIDLTPQRVFEIVATLLAKNEKLRNCTPQSIIGATLQCATLGLTPIPALAEAWLLPYREKVDNGRKDSKWINVCQFQIGYRGWISLFYRSGLVKSIEAQAVYSGDEFDFEYGTRKYIHHKRAKLGESRGELIGVYAIVRLMTGGINFVVMDLDEINDRRLRNPQYAGTYAKPKNQMVGAWDTDFVAMALTKPLRELRRLTPSTQLLDSAAAVDGRRILLDDFATDGTGVNAAGLPLAEVIGEAPTTAETGMAVEPPWNGPSEAFDGQAEQGKGEARKSATEPANASSLAAPKQAKEPNGSSALKTTRKPRI